MAIGPYSVAAAGVIRRGDSAFCIRRNDTREWEPPGGRIEVEEGIPSGLRRELLEETGLTVNIQQLAAVYKDVMKGIVTFVFRCEYVSGAPELNDEVIAYEWLTRDRILEYVRPVQAQRFVDAWGRVEYIHFREHDGTSLESTDSVGRSL